MERSILALSYFIEDWLKARVDGKCLLEHRSRPIIAAQSRIDHSRMEIEPCVCGLEAQRIDYVRQRRVWFAVTIEGPRECVISIDISPDLKFASRKLESSLMFDVVIRIKVDENAIIEHSVKAVQPRDKLDQVTLFVGLLLASQFYVHVTESGSIFRQRNYGDSSEVKAGGVVKLPLRSPYLAEDRKRSMIYRVGV